MGEKYLKFGVLLDSWFENQNNFGSQLFLFEILLATRNLGLC
jgi:hypothetical protein